MTSLPSNEAVESAGRVKVFIRVRPQNSIEAGKGGQVNAALKLDAKAGEVEVLDATEFTQGSQRRFTFDGVFTPESKQEDVFDAIGKPTVDRVLAGFNGTVLAYGQTSSGKTHTMMGPGGGAAEALRAEQRGITPRVLQHLMASLTALPEVEVSWTVQLSVCELYNEELFDLGLAPGEEGAGELRIREDRTSGRGVFVENLKTVSVKTAEEALQMMMKAAERKRVAATNANETSSRSHTIVQLLIEQVNNVDGGTKTSSQLFLVDLAGSERLSKAFSTSERVKEAQNINLSLTLLGNVINKLTDGKALHIPYRDSKLTRLLQDSLGGNAMTTLLCACSPSTFNAAETLSTLMFANRAKRIENRPRANKILSDDELRKAYIRALDEIRNLEDTVRTLRQLLTDSPSTATPPPLSARGRPLSGAPSRSIMRSPSQSKIPLHNNGSSTPPSQDDTQLQLDELRDAVRCLTLDLKDAREEVQRVDQCWSDAAKKVTFYQARDAKQRQLIAERDQRHADLAAEIIKLQESLAAAAAKPCVQCTAAAKKAASSTVTIKAATVATPARTSVASKSFVKPSTSSQAPTAPAPATHRPLEVQAIVRIGGQRKVTVAEMSTQTNEGTKAASAIPQAIVAPRPASEMSAAASQALLDSIKASASDREAFLLSLLEMMKNESGFLLKYKIIIERLNRELSFNEADTNRKLAKQSQVYESQNARQERRLRELQVQLAIALKNGKNDDYLEMLNDATEGKSLQVLQMENVHLQEDNREHMRQITRLSARVEALQSDLNRRILEAEGHIE